MCNYLNTTRFLVNVVQAVHHTCMFNREPPIVLVYIYIYIYIYKGYTQKNGAVSKGNKEFISHFSRAQRTPSAAETAQVSHALPAVRFSCLMRGRGASFQDGVAAGKGFLCAPC